MSSSFRAAAVLAPSLLALVFACGSSVDRSSEIPAGSSGSSGAGTSGMPGPGPFGSSGGTSGASGTSGNVTCAATSAKTEKAKVDIIFVIDDSGSMTEEMASIQSNVNKFATTIAGTGLDYHVVFIVRRGTQANNNQICVPAPLAGASCGDKLPTFHHVNQDVQSTDSFRLILSTYDSSNALLRWSGDLRMEATKVFIEVSDDTSDLPETSFDSQLLAKQPAGMFGTATDRHYIWNSIVNVPLSADTTPLTATTTATCPTGAGPSQQYQKLSLLTKGHIGSVCSTNFDSVLTNIAKGIVDKLGCELTYPKAEAADPTKLAVAYTPKGGTAQTLTQVTDVSKCGTIPNAWYYDNATNPTKIILCPSTCTATTSSPDGKIEALVGCKGAPPS